jgi:hypothetical protein
MKLTFKYIIVDAGAILFSENAIHAVVGEGFKQLSLPIYSAGFCTFESGEVDTIVCHGYSESLKLNSNPEIDKIVISDLFNPVGKFKYHLNQIKDLYKLKNK